jgi:hypothetical protein
LKYPFKFFSGDLQRAIGFTARLTTGAYLGDGQTVKYDNVITNYGGGYNRWTGHFTAPRKGLYQFTFSIMCPPGKHTSLVMVKNGKGVVVVYSDGHGYDTDTEAVAVVLRRGDSVWMKQHGGRYLHPWHTLFTGVLISGRV